MADWGSWQCWFQIIGFFLIFVSTIFIFIVDHPWWAQWYAYGVQPSGRTLSAAKTAATTLSTTLASALLGNSSRLLKQADRHLKGSNLTSYYNGSAMFNVTANETDNYELVYYYSAELEAPPRLELDKWK